MTSESNRFGRRKPCLRRPPQTSLIGCQVSSIATYRVWPLALLLCRLSLARAFRQSGLGPLWNSIGVAVAVAAVGTLFGTILRRQLVSFDTYVDSLAAGLVIWSFLSAVVGENSIAFARWMPILRHSNISLSVITLSVFLHHLPVLALNLGLFLLLQYLFLGFTPTILPLAASLLLLLVNVAWMGAAAMVLGARFRDVGQLIANLLQITFLLTPILWPPYFLGRFEYLLLLNPFHHLLSTVGAAAIGNVAPAVNWWVSLAMALTGGLASVGLYRWSRPRWPYWI